MSGRLVDGEDAPKAAFSETALGRYRRISALSVF
jgi:hypothetical protein